jgi:ferredoxin
MRGREVLAMPGETLRSALLRRGLSPHNGNSKTINCRGLGTCGTCAVEICPSSSAGVEPAARTRAEELRLALPPHRPPLAPRLRLACQCRIAPSTALVEDAAARGPVLVLHKYSGFWGSEPPLANEAAEAFAAPLGELEYVLDRGSRAAADALDARATRGAPADAATGDAAAAGGRAAVSAGAASEAGAQPCGNCGGSQMAPCPACDAVGYYECTYRLPDERERLGTMEVVCASCKGRGTVICRACFRGDPYDLEAVREVMRRKPD